MRRLTIFVSMVVALAAFTSSALAANGASTQPRGNVIFVISNIKGVLSLQAKVHPSGIDAKGLVATADCGKCGTVTIFGSRDTQIYRLNAGPTVHMIGGYVAYLYKANTKEMYWNGVSPVHSSKMIDGHIWKMFAASAAADMDNVPQCKASPACGLMH